MPPRPSGLEHFRFFPSRRNSLRCFLTIPDAKPLRTPAGIALAAVLAEADDGRDGAMVVRRFIGHAPVYVVVNRHAVARPLAQVEIAQAASARRLPAAIVVADQILLSITGVLAGADPGDVGHGGVGWTLADRPAATGA